MKNFKNENLEGVLTEEELKKIQARYPFISGNHSLKQVEEILENQIGEDKKKFQEMLKYAEKECIRLEKKQEERNKERKALEEKFRKEDEALEEKFRKEDEAEEQELDPHEPPEEPKQEEVKQPEKDPHEPPEEPKQEEVKQPEKDPHEPPEEPKQEDGI